MFAGLVTMIAYVLGIAATLRRVPALWQVPAIATLPVGWISLCGIAGCGETVFGVDSRITLGIFLAALACMAFVFTPPSPIDVSSFSGRRCTLTALGIAVACAAGTGWLAHRLQPWGGWDALFTWVMKARFFELSGPRWLAAFSNDLALLHPDYPPLLGFALRALWKLDGSETSAAAAWLTFPVWPAFVLVVLGWWRLRNPGAAITLTIPVAILLATPLLWKLAAEKLADFILAYSVLTCAAWWVAGRHAKSVLPFVVAGFLAGWSGLIKNEGVLWGMVSTLTMLFTAMLSRRKRARLELASWFAGAAVPVCCILLFKITLAPPSDLVSPGRTFQIGEVVQPGTMINSAPLVLRFEQVLDPVWHRMIWEHAADVLLNIHDWGLTLWAVLALILIRVGQRLTRGRSLSPVLCSVMLQLLGYYCVYLVTPYHPYWHLSTSLSRILTHLVPAALCLLAFEGTRSDENSPQSTVRWNVARITAASYLIVVSLFNFVSVATGKWNLGEQPKPDLRELREIEFPPVETASFVSTSLGIRDLYLTQFEAVPTILSVDRREAILLARFRDQQELVEYCTANGWQLQKSRAGLGWARDVGGESLKQPVQVAPLQ